MLAAPRQARVVMIGKAGWRLDRLKTLGFARWSMRRPATSSRGPRRTAGRGAELTVDATGRPEVWELAVDTVGRGGSVLFLGGCAPAPRSD
jgi:threonine dehydrogenase-like Zn-dependent dehydrogenase